MLDYFRAVKANKITLAGFALVAGSFALNSDTANEKLAKASTFCAGGMLIAGSFAAAETYSAYRRTKEHIARDGKLESFFQDSYGLYCGASGVLAAARHCGRSQDITAHLSECASLKRIVGERGIAYAGSGALMVGIGYVASMMK